MMCRRLALVLSLSLMPGCSQWPECDLSRTCREDLYGILEQKVQEVAGVGGIDYSSGRCEQCLRRPNGCSEKIESCSMDASCNNSARCLVTNSPIDYRECLTTLMENGFSVGDEGDWPWEGSLSILKEPGGVLCPLDRCGGACLFDQKWFCLGTYGIAQDEREKFTAKLALREFTYDGGYVKVTDPEIDVCACLDEPDQRCTAKKCNEAPPDEHGVVEVSVDSMRYRYFEITSESGKFPRTLFYPGMTLPTRAIQPIQVYLFSTDTVEGANSSLLGLRSVLKNHAQSVVFPSSCVWEETATPGLTFRVERASTGAEGEAPCAAEGDALPLCEATESEDEVRGCVWYAAPDGRLDTDGKEMSKTSARGGGIAGLEEGSYTIKVCDGKKMVAVRERIWMIPGALTVVRTWPLTKTEYQQARRADDAADVTR